MRGIDLVTGYGDKQQLPAVVQIKEDAVHVRDQSSQSDHTLSKHIQINLWSEEHRSNEIGKMKASGHCGVKH